MGLKAVGGSPQLRTRPGHRFGDGEGLGSFPAPLQHRVPMGGESPGSAVRSSAICCNWGSADLSVPQFPPCAGRREPRSCCFQWGHVVYWMNGCLSSAVGAKCKRRQPGDIAKKEKWHQSWLGERLHGGMEMGTRTMMRELRVSDTWVNTAAISLPLSLSPQVSCLLPRLTAAGRDGVAVMGGAGPHPALGRAHHLLSM